MMSAQDTAAQPTRDQTGGTSAADDGPCPPLPSDVPVEVAAKLYRSLGDPTRLRLLLSLVDGERRVVDLVAQVGLAQSTVSAHLACLRDCGLLTVRPEGRQSFYRLAHDVRELLAATEALLGRTGLHVELCPTYEPACPA